MSIERTLTEREYRYLETSLQNDFKMLKGVFWFVVLLFSTFFVFSAWLTMKAASYGSGDILGILVANGFMVLVFVFLVKYLKRRAWREISINGEVVSISGAYRMEWLGRGKTSRILHFIGDHCVSFPRYWLDHYISEGDHVDAEGYVFSRVGIDRAIHPDVTIILTIESGRISVDEDVRRGSLSAKGPGMWVASIVAFAVGVFVFGIDTDFVVVPAIAFTVGVVTALLALRNYRFNKRLVASLVQD